MSEVSVPQPRARPRKRPDAIAGDRACDADWIRQWCADKGIESAIPARKDLRDGPGRPPTLGDQRHRDRNTVERYARHLKERWRLVAYARRRRVTPKRQPKRPAAALPLLFRKVPFEHAHVDLVGLEGSVDQVSGHGNRSGAGV